MKLKSLSVKNFKSFKEMNIELKDFNVVIGANASGKSNFVQVFKFLRDIINLGLENAVSIQGDIEYLTNLKEGQGEELSIGIVCEIEDDGKFANTKQNIEMTFHEMKYEFSLKEKKGSPGFKIVNDCLLLKFKFKDENGKIIEGEIRLSHKKDKLVYEIFPKGIEDKVASLVPLLYLKMDSLPQNLLLIQTPLFFIWRRLTIDDIFRNISIYDFEPKKSKEAAPITGKAELEENGSNLAKVVKNILENEEKRRKLFNLVSDILPFVNNLFVEKLPDKSLLFKLQESYFEKKDIPASLLSDGTINVIAMIIALYFEKKKFVIFEEPERNIHPFLISKVIEMMKEISRKKQIIVTTHNPEVVKYAGIDNLLLVSRGRDGFSRIYRPLEKDQIKIFLENDLGIEELFIQNLLEVGA
ncbi:AAA family ATPase [Caldicellulosiruptor morganii]|uniref:AAA family ATPase n=1 Tax=Caldicellulosiruptor morganii TaxID=1387555 RepID=A0ABY7BR97_9FIRM|nr:AAA family ATPase [Caldicellulosiruptor morganii]WAM33999.1 AAA family ATPase [Caldicellulosiruptor morganii]